MGEAVGVEIRSARSAEVGNTLYARFAGDSGEEAVIDPMCDVGRYLDVAASGLAELSSLFEARIQNGLVSSVRELMLLFRVRLSGSKNRGLRCHYEHRCGGDDFDLGPWMLEVTAVPEHLANGISYVEDSPTLYGQAS